MSMMMMMITHSKPALALSLPSASSGSSSSSHTPNFQPKTSFSAVFTLDSASLSFAPRLPSSSAWLRSRLLALLLLLATVLLATVAALVSMQLPRMGMVMGTKRNSLRGNMIVVAKDGTGDYTTVQAALDAAVSGTAALKFSIYIRKGRYLETVTVPSRLSHINIVGDPGQTIISAAHWAGEVPRPGPWVWSAGVATVTVLASDVVIRNMIFENTHGPGIRESHSWVDQGVALQVNGTRVAVYDSTMLGYQDTLYTATGRQYYENCDIYGRVDFVFGFSKAAFKSCRFYLRYWGGAFFANGKRSQNEDSGYLVEDSFFYLDGDAKEIMPGFIGRGWGNYSFMVVKNTYMASGTVHRRGWDFVGGFESDKVQFYEYKSYGPGSDISKRVKFSKQLSDAEAAAYAVTSFVDTPPWIPPRPLATLPAPPPQLPHDKEQG